MPTPATHEAPAATTTFCPFKAPSHQLLPFGDQVVPVRRFEQRPGFSLALAELPSVPGKKGTPWFCPSFLQIASLSEGALDIVSPEGKRVKLFAGDWFLLKPANADCFVRVLSPCRMHWLDCDAEASSSLVGFSDQLALPLREPNRPYFASGTATGRLRLLAEQLSNINGDRTAERLLAEARTLEWLALLLDHPIFSPCRAVIPKENDRDELALTAAARILDTRPHENHSIARLSREVHLNEFKLKKGFRERYQTTVFGYLRQRRVEKARQLLEEGNLSVIEVANAVGYSNPSHFAKAFRDAFGANPSEFASARQPSAIEE